MNGISPHAPTALQSARCSGHCPDRDRAPALPSELHIPSQRIEELQP